MVYGSIRQGRFIERINRFVARVSADGKIHSVHVKNTGRLKELLKPGAVVYLEECRKPSRKTAYSLISCMKGDTLVNIDSQVPNLVVYEAALEGKIPGLGKIKTLKREVSYGSSRFDLYFESELGRGFIEVKGVTLEVGGAALFPDAPTLRGARHVLEMAEAVKSGYIGHILFLVQFRGANWFMPNTLMDEAFGRALAEAAAAGVALTAFDSVVAPGGITFGDELKVILR